MDPTPGTLTIGIPIYPGVDPLDVIGPYEVFSDMAATVAGQCAVTVLVLGETLAPVTTREFGEAQTPAPPHPTPPLALVPQATFESVPHLDVLWVPGGAVSALNRMIPGGPYLDAITKWAAGASFVTSVCEGAMLLAAAGLLDGYRATTHWAFLPCFSRWPAVKPVGGKNGKWPRFVVDPKKPEPGALGTRVTGAGISAGLDEALEIVVRLFGKQVAREVQKDIQYFPDPPVKARLRPAKGCPLG
ncbi:MAG TPA: DJ-1/PfpI family protein [Longimicrobium sp.]|nr:DJ-1/PfpI family protein [Longimicrobium sp.]